jgi:hypothetical protein
MLWPGKPVSKKIPTGELGLLPAFVVVLAF